MRIRVVAVGRIMQQLKGIQDYYVERLKGLEVVEVRKGVSREREGRSILRHVRGFTVILDERGEELTSVEFSRLVSGKREITFVVGGADGLSEEVKEKGDFKLSLSRMTLQHDIARVVLLEQIYRAVQIARGSKYHRG